MLHTKLILVEGIPGSGKSSTAQSIAASLTRQGIANRWWYEEDKEHPLYIFNDLATCEQVIYDLTSGNYREVVKKALQHWQSFADALQAAEEIIVVDGCHFGYLTWSLFANCVAAEETQAYLIEVERILAPCNPSLIYLYQNDVAAAMRKISMRRDTEDYQINSVVQSNYGKARGLSGFAGMVTYWQDYRTQADEFFKRSRFAKIAIENFGGDWASYYAELLGFLALDEIPETIIVSSSQLQCFTGRYADESGSGQECSILLSEARLTVDGLRHVWKQTTLLPRSTTTFAIQSLPFLLEFTADPSGDGITLLLTGTTQLSAGEINARFRKVEGTGRTNQLMDLG